MTTTNETVREETDITIGREEGCNTERGLTHKSSMATMNTAY